MKQLREGYTTGSCAAAASFASVLWQTSGKCPEWVELEVPAGKLLHLEIQAEEAYTCGVQKDGGDDPDETNGCLVTASVEILPAAGAVQFRAGTGVGTITRKGLKLPVGEPAINPVPRQMIEENVREVCALVGYDGGLDVTISAPEGEALAKKTFNPRLGIEGGISILGTTGIVEPMSEQALLDTIRVELRQRRENGADYILLAPGNYGADYIRDFIGLDPKTAVLTSNFIGDSLEFCKEFGFHGALLIGHIGKFVKLAGGMWNTHSKFGDCRMEIIASHSAALGLRAERTEEILHCATCDDALRILDEEGLKDAFLVRLGQRIGTMLGYKSGELQSGAILFSKEYGFLCETEHAEELLKTIREG